MPVAPRPVSEDALAEARRLYELTNVPVKDIALQVGLSERTFYDRVKLWNWSRRADRAKAEPPPARAEADVGAGAEPRSAEMFGQVVSWIGRPCPGLALCPERAVLIARLWRATEAHIHRVERRLGRAEPHEDARVVATLAGTLDKLVALDREALKLARSDAKDAPDADDAKSRHARALARLANALAAFGGEPDAGDPVSGEPPA